MNVSKFSMVVILCLGLVSASDYLFVDELRKEIEELKVTTANEIKLHRAETAETATALKKTENIIQLQKAETAETATSLRKAENEIQALRAEIEVMKLEIQNPKRGHDSKRFVLVNPLAEKPAFSAALTQHAMNLGNNQPIVFDKAFTNDLGAYSPITGVFTVPMNGTYFFIATVMSHSGQYIETEICLNGQTLVLMYSADTRYEQGTNSVVLVLKAGDIVWVRHHGTEGSNAFGENWSSFSGFMI